MLCLLPLLPVAAAQNALVVTDADNGKVIFP